MPFAALTLWALFPLGDLSQCCAPPFLCPRADPSVALLPTPAYPPLGAALAPHPPPPLLGRHSATHSLASPPTPPPPSLPAAAPAPAQRIIPAASPLPPQQVSPAGQVAGCALLASSGSLLPTPGLSSPPQATMRWPLQPSYGIAADSPTVLSAPPPPPPPPQGHSPAPPSQQPRRHANNYHATPTVERLAPGAFREGAFTAAATTETLAEDEAANANTAEPSPPPPASTAPPVLPLPAPPACLTLLPGPAGAATVPPGAPPPRWAGGALLAAPPVATSPTHPPRGGFSGRARRVRDDMLSGGSLRRGREGSGERVSGGAPAVRGARVDVDALDRWEHDLAPR